MNGILERRVTSFALLGRILEDALHRPDLWSARLEQRVFPVVIEWEAESMTLATRLGTMDPGTHVVEFLSDGELMVVVPVTFTEASERPTIRWRLDFANAAVHA